MLRRLLTILLCLCLGVIINFAVAWACASLCRLGTTSELAMPGRFIRGDPSDQAAEEERCWITVFESHGFGITQHNGLTFLATDQVKFSDRIIKYRRLFGGSDGKEIQTQVITSFWTRINSFGNHDDYYGFDFEEAAGWPFRSLWRGVGYNKPGNYMPIPAWSISLGNSDPYDRALPYRPIWQGFVGNSLIYALVVFMLLRIMSLTRSKIRRLHRLCGRCCYDLRGASHTQCPECGAAVTVNVNDSTIK